MSWVLFSSILKSNTRSILSYAIGMILYLWLFIWIYPSFSGSESLNNLLQQAPKGLMKVLGYTAGITHLSDFLGGEFYSLFYLIIMSIYCIFFGTKLVAHLIENGSMAQLLATPVSRIKVTTTLAAVLISGVFIICLCCTAGGLLGAHWFVQNPELNAVHFLQLNIVGFLLFCVIASYCFLMSCLARDERSALGLSAICTVLFYVLHMVGTLSQPLSWMNHLSLFAAFNAQSLIHGHDHFAVTSTCLASVAVAVFALGIVGFRKRQLVL